MVGTPWLNVYTYSLRNGSCVYGVLMLRTCLFTNVVDDN